MAVPDDEHPLDHFETVNRELLAYAPILAEKPQVVVATKMDVASAKDAWVSFQSVMKAHGRRVVAISAVTGEGIGTLLDELQKVLTS
jgi:GTP-binding protein